MVLFRGSKKMGRPRQNIFLLPLVLLCLFASRGRNSTAAAVQFWPATAQQHAVLAVLLGP